MRVDSELSFANIVSIAVARSGFSIVGHIVFPKR
jgi:hypothetical protein